MEIHYRIRHKRTRRWSRGGSVVHGNGYGYNWTDDASRAKTWNTLGKIRAHLTTNMNMATRQANAPDVADWEIVELKISYHDVKQLHEIIDKKKLLDILKS
jgi:hypothetical protein